MALGERGQAVLLAYGNIFPPIYDHKAHTAGCIYFNGTFQYTPCTEYGDIGQIWRRGMS